MFSGLVGLVVLGVIVMGVGRLFGHHHHHDHHDHHYDHHHDHHHHH